MLKEYHFDHYFHNSYEKCRENFLNSIESLKLKHSSIEINSLNVPSKTDNNLFIDTALIKTDKKNKNLIILTSGLHGVEISTGNALQLLLLERLSSNSDLFKGIDFLFVHAMNPWGAKNGRRVNEYNVDLNRNFSVSKELFSTKNKPYEELNKYFNPTKKLKTGFLNYYLFVSKIFFQALVKSKVFVSEAIGVGQYQFDKGVVFGGFNFQKEKEVLHPIFEQTIANYKTIVTIDLHTGLGKKSELHILNAPNSDKKTKEDTNLLFDGKVVKDEDEDFYKEHGSFLDYISSLCTKEQTCLPIMFEFGTINTNTLLGGAKLLVNTCLENQGFQHGYKRKIDEKRIKRNYQGIFTLPCNEWRSKITTLFNENINLIAKNIDKIRNN